MSWKTHSLSHKRDVAGGISSGYLTKFPHHIVPSDNFGNKNNNCSRKKYSTYAIPLLINNTDFSQDDFFVNEVKQKSQNICNDRHHRAIFNRYIRRSKTHEEAKKKSVYCKFFNTIIESPGNNDDLDYIYNDRFTGGTVQGFKVADDQCILHTIDNDAILSKLLYDKKRNEISVKHLLNLPLEYGRIYEVFKSNSSMFSLRHKNHFSIINMDFDNFNVTNQITIKSDIGFHSGCFEKNESNKFYSIDRNQMIQCWDIETSDVTNRSVGSLSNQHDIQNSWSCIQQYDRNIISLINRKQLFLIDVRTDSGPQSNWSFDVYNHMDHCENISCLKNFDQYGMLSTTHYLFSFDYRLVKRENNFLSRWTHQFTSPPNIIKTFTDQILVGGTNPSDIALCCHHLPFACKNLPHHPVGPMVLLNNAQKLGYLLHPKLSFTLNDLLNSSLIGWDVITVDDTEFIISQSYNGNLIQRQISDSPIIQDPGEFVEFVKQFDSNLMDLIGSMKYKCTNVSSLRDMFDVLKCNLDTVENDVENIVPERSRQRWQKSPQELSKYTDALAKDMLKLWNLDTHDLMSEYVT